MILLVSMLWVLGAACNAVMDVLAFKYKSSVFRNLNPDYWNPSISWRNKYKNKNPKEGAAFFGSTTFFSFLTDAWHMFQFLSNSCVAMGLSILVIDILEFDWKYLMPVFLLFKLAWGVGFEALFGHGLRIKK